MNIYEILVPAIVSIIGFIITNYNIYYKYKMDKLQKREKDKEKVYFEVISMLERFEKSNWMVYEWHEIKKIKDLRPQIILKASTEVKKYFDEFCDWIDGFYNLSITYYNELRQENNDELVTEEDEQEYIEQEIARYKKEIAPNPCAMKTKCEKITNAMRKDLKVR